MPLLKHPLNLYQKTAFFASILLCILCIAWEWFLAPLRPNGSFMVLKSLPIVFLLPGLYRGANYQLQTLSMVILLYFLEGVSRLFEKGLNPWLAGLELILSSVIFFAVLMYLGPLKKAAKAKKEALKSQDSASNT
jgi:uncharacterized membrane protein